MNASNGSSQWSAERVKQYRERVFTERDRLVEATTEGVARQHTVLADLLAHNANTTFGRKYGFDQIRSIDDFRKAVPIHDYSALSPWIDQMADGASNILSADDPVVYFTSSGSTGAHKKVPVTARFMHTCFFPFFYAAWAPLAEHFPDVISEPDSVLNLKHDPLPVPATTASGRPHLGASQVDFGTKFGEPLSAEPGTNASWATLPVAVAGDDHHEKAYLRLRRAVEGDVRCVIGINPAMVAALPHQLELWWPRIVREIRDGIWGDAPYTAPNPERAAELEALAARHWPVLPAHIWPNLKVVFCWTTGLASLYLPRLREELGIGVSVLPAPVAASEGPVGVALDRHSSAGTLVVTASLYEFVDADEPLGADATTLELHELEPGREYHVIFSHVGGLYRYAVGDVVRVVDMVAGVPRVEYAGRNSLSNAHGERLRESHVIRALAAALTAGGLEVRNAACRVDAGRYEFALEPRLPWSARETATLADRLDAQLAEVAPGYRDARAANLLAPLAVHRVPPRTFVKEWHDEVAAGTRPAQVKDRLFRRDAANWRRLLDNREGDHG